MKVPVVCGQSFMIAGRVERCVWFDVGSSQRGDVCSLGDVKNAMHHVPSSAIQPLEKRFRERSTYRASQPPLSSPSFQFQFSPCPDIEDSGPECWNASDCLKRDLPLDNGDVPTIQPVLAGFLDGHVLKLSRWVLRIACCPTQLISTTG